MWDFPLQPGSSSKAAASTTHRKAKGCMFAKSQVSSCTYPVRSPRLPLKPYYVSFHDAVLLFLLSCRISPWAFLNVCWRLKRWCLRNNLSCQAGASSSSCGPHLHPMSERRPRAVNFKTSIIKKVISCRQWQGKKDKRCCVVRLLADGTVGSPDLRGAQQHGREGMGLLPQLTWTTDLFTAI